MKYLSTSILSIKEDLINNIKKIDHDTDYIHLDIMDGKFVPNKTWDINQTNNFINNHQKPLDVHLMVYDVKKYIEDFSLLNPEYITFHLEAVNDVNEVINYIKSKNIKVGLSIKPNTEVDSLIPYLDKVDLVLVMSVEPGFGGQKYLESATTKINKLKNLRNQNGYSYKIEVDGGVNNETINNCLNADLFVVGSYITCSDNYIEKIEEIKRIINE